MSKAIKRSWTFLWGSYHSMSHFSTVSEARCTSPNVTKAYLRSWGIHEKLYAPYFCQILFGDKTSIRTATLHAGDGIPFIRIYSRILNVRCRMHTLFKWLWAHLNTDYTWYAIYASARACVYHFKVFVWKFVALLHSNFVW